MLAQCGYRVIGLDARAYLSSFTTNAGALRPDEVVDDYMTLIKYASRGGGRSPVLIGVSEGAGLSVLAGTGKSIKPLIEGVIGVGLGDMNELGWRWTDSTIYLTHHLPREPLFSVLSMVDHLAPVPLAWLKEIGADPDRLNVNGGAIALGHPLGASGTKLMATLVHALRARGKRFGLQTMCEGGGIANVTIVEAL